MGFIKNYSDLAITPQREIVLDLIEVAFNSIKPENVLANKFKVKDNILTINHKRINLNDYEKTFILAFGKGSAKIAKLMEKELGIFLNGGFVIDIDSENFEKLEFCLGTHPIPSETNIEFSKKAVDALSNLNEKTLILTVACGGGSALFEIPNIELSKLIEINKTLLTLGADIKEINTVRKHLSKTKGGGLVKLLAPAKVVSLIFSDVPGNDLQFIASGPTAFDNTSLYDAIDIYHKFKLKNHGLTEENFTETPKNEKLFENVENVLMLTNLIPLEAMKKKCEELKIKAEIFSDKFQSDAELAATSLIKQAKPHSILLIGGETTYKVINDEGKGGRNQVVVLAGIYEIDDKTIIASFDTDGWDNSPASGAIADMQTLEKAKNLGINPLEYLKEDNSFVFFKNTQDAIITDRLKTNVSDLIIIYKE